MARISLAKTRKKKPTSTFDLERRRVRRITLSGFRDLARRPRYIVWTGVALVTLAAVVIVALGVTSTRWFCAEGCHKVQDDTILAYERSSHSEISCMACHMPVGADPITFVLHKAEALGELYLTVTDNFELPLNAQSHVALEMESKQCLQCHNLENRAVTPADGIVIDHDAHAEEGLGCAVCHNRVAHIENFNLTLKDPSTGEPNKKHEQFMTMTACFRCHEQGSDGRAPGECKACHTAGFQLKPASHLEDGFYPKGHAAMAKDEASRTAEPTRTAEGVTSETPEGRPVDTTGHGEALDLPTVASIDYCSTCHSKTFCTDCHGIPMPHPADFKKGHGDSGKKDPESCALCHGDAERFCDECHHGTAMDLPYDGSQGPWRRAHPAGVRALGASRCFECHDPTFCAHCHVRGISK